MFKTLLLLVSIVVPVLAMAASDDTKRSVAPALDVSTSFSKQRQVIEKKLADGKTYGEISSHDRSKVRDALTRISETLGAEDDLATLREEKKTRIFNDQELINNILTKAGEDSRLICERVEKVGTHRTTTQCLTVAERRRLRDLSQDRVHNQQSAGPSLKGGG